MLTVSADGKINMADTRAIFIGRSLTGTTVTALRNGDHVTVYTTHGEPIGHLTLDLTRRYQGKLTPITAAG